MHITFRPIRRAATAFALVMTLLFLAFNLALFVSMMYWTSTNAKITARNSVFNTSAYAAEAATERVLAQMDRDFTFQTVNQDLTTYNKILPDQTSWPVTYTISDASNVVNQISISILPQDWAKWNNFQGLGSRYAGLYGAVANCTLIATATPQNQPNIVPATVCQQFQLASIPVFQAGVFYNMDLAIEPGASLTMNGPVFCNANI